MTPPNNPASSPPVGLHRWRSARRELGIAASLVIALTGSAWILLGAATAGIVALICISFALVVLRTLVPPPAAPVELTESLYDAPTLLFTGYWRTQFELNAGTKSLSAWDMNTRRRLANLLAARLAERHGISLTDDPEAARTVFMGTSRRHDLWYWIDPQRPTPVDATSRPGIPRKDLVALIQRLEQL